jgi:DNA invertase Pin-like site-specific DNA recombinase
MRPAAYIRVSSIDQTEGYSLDSQRRIIADYCRAKGWPEPRVFADEGVSAFTDELERRPAFRAVLAAAEARHIDAVVILDVDRFARSALTALWAKDQLQRHGCLFLSVYQGWDFGSPDGHLLFTVNSGVAEYYSRQLSRKVRAGLEQKRLAGGHVGGVPYGAVRVAGRLTVDPAYAEPLAYVLGLIPRLGPGPLATRLNVEGVPTQRGGRWQPRTIYALAERSGWLLDHPEPWPTLHRAAADRATMPRVRRDRTVRMLSGLMKCPCGGTLVYHGERRGNGRPDRQTVICYSRKLRPTGYGCSVPHTYADVYEDLVSAWVVALPDLRDVEPVERDVGAERAALAERRRRLGQSYRDLTIAEGEYLREKAALDRLDAALPRAPVDWRELGRWVATLQADWCALTPAARNAALRRLIRGVLVEGRAAEVLPLPALAELLAAI